MANYGPNSLIISFTDSGATPRIMTPFVRTFNGMDVQAILVDNTTFGVAWQQWLYSNINKVAPVTMRGRYDDVALGPNAIFNAPGATRTLLVTWGGSKTSSSSALIADFKRIPVVNDLLDYEVTVNLSGTVTET